MGNCKFLHYQKKGRECEILKGTQSKKGKSEILNPCELDPKRAKNVKF